MRTLLLLFASLPACSVGLDFDRGYPGRADDIGNIFGTGVLPAPKPGEAVDVGMCDTLCTAWFNCLADDDRCHRFTLTQPADKAELILLCALRCERSQSVTRSQVEALAEPAQCDRAAQRFLALYPDFEAACRFFRDECDNVCREWPETFTACQDRQPGECEVLCLDTPLSFWTCLDEVNASRTVACDDIARCAGLAP